MHFLVCPALTNVTTCGLAAVSRLVLASEENKSDQFFTPALVSIAEVSLVNILVECAGRLRVLGSSSLVTLCRQRLFARLCQSAQDIPMGYDSQSAENLRGGVKSIDCFP